MAYPARIVIGTKWHSWFTGRKDYFVEVTNKHFPYQKIPVSDFPLALYIQEQKIREYYAVEKEIFSTNLRASVQEALQELMVRSIQ